MSAVSRSSRVLVVVVAANLAFLPGCDRPSKPDVGPTADFSANPTSGNAPLTVQFTDQSTPGTKPITGWSWPFGDGEPRAEETPTPQHSSASGSPYAVSLTETTAVGSSPTTPPGYITVSCQTLV